MRQCQHIFTLCSLEDVQTLAPKRWNRKLGIVLLMFSFSYFVLQFFKLIKNKIAWFCIKLNTRLLVSYIVMYGNAFSLIL